MPWAGLPVYIQENNMRLIELEKVIQASHIRGMGRRKIKYSLLIGRSEEKREFKRHRCYSQYDIKMYLKGMRWKKNMAKGFLDIKWLILWGSCQQINIFNQKQQHFDKG